MASSNPRYECSSPTCNAKITRNQLRGSNGICIYCKTPMSHTQWMGGQQATIGQMLALPTDIDEELKDLSKSTGLEIRFIINAALTSAMVKWRNADNTEKSVKDDMMLAKLMTP